MMLPVREGTRGFTIIEMMVGAVIGAFILLGAVSFAQHQLRMYGISTEVLEMTQAGNAALALMVEDLSNAGAGIGYNAAGGYSGLELGGFVRGGAQFDADLYPNAYTLAGTGETYYSSDLGIKLADGEYVTITSYTPGANSISFCAPSQFKAGDLVALTDASSLSTKTVKLIAFNNNTCGSSAQCTGGCENWTYQDTATLPDTDPTSGTAATTVGYASGGDALTAQYEGGEAHGNFRLITYWVESDGTNARLRRAIGNCANRDPSCGDVVAENVERLLVRVREFDAATSQWIDRTPDNTGLDAPLRLVSTNRIRVDVELVVRSRYADLEGQKHTKQQLFLTNPASCTPGPACGGIGDQYRRAVFRESVEIRDSSLQYFNR
jgi:hypothetical protein